MKNNQLGQIYCPNDSNLLIDGFEGSGRPQQNKRGEILKRWRAAAEAVAAKSVKYGQEIGTREKWENNFSNAFFFRRISAILCGRMSEKIRMLVFGGRGEGLFVCGVCEYRKAGQFGSFFGFVFLFARIFTRQALGICLELTAAERERERQRKGKK